MAALLYPSASAETEHGSSRGGLGEAEKHVCAAAHGRDARGRWCSMAVPHGSSQAGARVWAEDGVVQPMMERPREPLSEGTASSTARSICSGGTTRRKNLYVTGGRAGVGQEPSHLFPPNRGEGRSAAAAPRHFPPPGIPPEPMLAFPVQLGRPVHSSSKLHALLRCSRRKPSATGFNGHFLITFYPFCSSLQAKL